MAYQAGGTDYTGMLRLRAQADEGVTRALKEKKERERREAEARSKKRSGIQKLGSAVVRGAAAYYTGGLSETMGGGRMIDEAILGKDAEVNEYGELAGMASQVGGAMSAQKAAGMAKKLEMQSQKDQAMQTRLDNLDPQLGMDFALKLEQKDKKNMAALEASKQGSFGGLFQGDVEGVDLEPTTVGDYKSILAKQEVDKTVPTVTHRDPSTMVVSQLGTGQKTVKPPDPYQADDMSGIPEGDNSTPSNRQPGIMNTGKTATPDPKNQTAPAGGYQADIIKQQLEEKKKQDAELAKTAMTQGEGFKQGDDLTYQRRKHLMPGYDKDKFTGKMLTHGGLHTV